MARKESANDIVLLKNIDVMCTDLATDQYKQYIPTEMADGKTQTRERDAFREYKHTDYFQVRWDNNPQRVRPGQTVAMVRYIASHFAKHLIDHILTKREKATGKENLLPNKAERDKLMTQIIVGVQNYYEPDIEIENEENIQVYEAVENLPDVDTNEPAQTNPDISFTLPNEPKAVDRTIHELRAEARQLGLDVQPTDKKVDLIAKIAAF